MSRGVKNFRSSSGEELGGAKGAECRSYVLHLSSSEIDVPAEIRLSIRASKCGLRLKPSAGNISPMALSATL
jgi:hypothetical protein